MKKSFLFFVVFALIALSGQYLNAQQYDSITFETPNTAIVIDTAAQNIWQIAKPAKIIFDSAYSGEKAIITDSVHNYPSGNNSSFLYIIRSPYTKTCLSSMSFRHKYDMDSMSKGTIEASYDGGKSWLIVSDTMVDNFEGTYFFWDYDYHLNGDSTSKHELNITGASNGWILSTFYWQWWMPVKSDSIVISPDSLMIKFTFTSDSASNGREGWMIDDIVTYAAALWQCSGIDETSGNTQITVYPNPFTTETTIKTTNGLSGCNIVLYNSYGQIARSFKNIKSQSVTLRRDKLPAGIYFLRISKNSRLTGSRKIIIQ